MSRRRTAAATTPRPRQPVRDRNRRSPPQLPAVYQVVVECHSERDQEAVYRQMKGEGRKCRILTL